MTRFATLAILLFAAALASADAPTQATAKIENFKLTHTLSGKFVPAETHDIQLKTRVLTGAKIQWRVPHGQVVKRGDALIRLEPKDTQRILRDKEIAVQIAEIDLKLAEKSYLLREFNTPRDIAYHKQTAKRAKDDYLSFVKTFRPLGLASLDIERRSMEYSLMSAKEEMRQLKKMYTADDLTEETEEMLLKRQKWSITYYEFKLKKIKINNEKAKTVTLPRRHDDLKRTLGLKQRDEKTYLYQLPLFAAKQKLELQQKRHTANKARTDLAKLRTLAASLTLRAPADGVVYYGRYTNGAFTSFKTAAAKLLPGAFLKANDIVMTIAGTKSIAMETSINESQLGQLTVGDKATLRAKGFPQTRLAATLKSFSLAPRDGKFIARFSVASHPSLRPGMSATGWWTPYHNPKALLLPAKFVHADAASDYVWLKTAKGPARTNVTAGHSFESKTEIVAGLSAGAVVLLSDKPVKPSPKPTDKPAVKQ
jgi:HlyD family secretion protein